MPKTAAQELCHQHCRQLLLCRCSVRGLELDLYLLLFGGCNEGVMHTRPIICWGSVGGKSRVYVCGGSRVGPKYHIRDGWRQGSQVSFAVLDASNMTENNSRLLKHGGYLPCQHWCSTMKHHLLGVKDSEVPKSYFIQISFRFLGRSPSSGPRSMSCQSPIGIILFACLVRFNNIKRLSILKTVGSWHGCWFRWRVAHYFTRTCMYGSNIHASTIGFI